MIPEICKNNTEITFIFKGIQRRLEDRRLLQSINNCTVQLTLVWKKLGNDDTAQER